MKALLTPVPLPLLCDSEGLCARAGKVAFGSNAWEVFATLDEIAGEGAPVLIYASHTDERPVPVATWSATYIRYVESKGGAHPDRWRFRARSARGEDTTGHWAGFYEVRDLARLVEAAQVPVVELGDRNGHRYKSPFIPEGPTVVTRI